MPLTTLSFYNRFEQDILSKQKTITIRDASESDFTLGSAVHCYTFDDHRHFADVTIHSVTPIDVSEINQQHAKQENMSLAELKRVIQSIYPNTQQLFVIEFSLI